MKLLIDANLSSHWKQWLASAGIEAIHWTEVGAGADPDSDIMAFAAANRFTILTRDLDFGKLLVEQNATIPSVVQMRGKDVRPHTFGDALLFALSEAEPKLEDGAILTVTLNRPRLTLLPLRKTLE